MRIFAKLCPFVDSTRFLVYNRTNSRKRWTAMRTNYDIETTYDSAAINAMTRMTYDLYHPEVSGRIYLIAIAMMLAGGMGTSYSDNAFFMVLLALGCFVISGAEYGARTTAKQIVSSLKGDFPRMKFGFRQDNMVVTTPKETGVVQYDIITRLAENRQYLFMFTTQRSAYVIKKTDIPEAELNGFKAFIQARTGSLPFERAPGIGAKLKAGIKKT